MAPFGKVLRRVRAHPDGTALGLVLGVAALIRLAFLFRAPPFYVGGDSPTYLLPAVEVLQGAGFDPIVKRPPGYPLFLAGTMGLFGLDPVGTLFAQHLLGLGTVASTWALGRLTFGRAVALPAGLLVAVNGPLLIFEHYVMAETLFTLLVALAVTATVWAADGGAGKRALPMVLAGVLFGLASATRQSAQPLVLLVPLALLLAGTGWRGALRGSLAAAAGYLVVLVPWLTFDYARHQTLSSATLGETLVWRLTRSDTGDEFFKWKLPPVADAREQEARKLAFGQAADRVLPSDTKVELQRRFGLSEAEADRVLRSIALEAIQRQPDRYVGSSFELLLEHLLGTQQWLGGQGKEGGITRYSDAAAKYQGFWPERIRPLITNANPGQQQEFRRAQAIANLFQPWRFGALLLALFAAGVVASAARSGWRLGLVPTGAVLAVLLLAAFLAGDLPRYRYPADPMLAAVEMGGLVGLVGLARRLPSVLQTARRRRGKALRGVLGYGG